MWGSLKNKHKSSCTRFLRARVKVAETIANEHYSKLKGKTKISIETTRTHSEARIIKKRELYQIHLLSTGELAQVTIKNVFFAPLSLTDSSETSKKLNNKWIS